MERRMFLETLTAASLGVLAEGAFADVVRAGQGGRLVVRSDEVQYQTKRCFSPNTSLSKEK
jgi:hypothetical protein